MKISESGLTSSIVKALYPIYLALKEEFRMKLDILKIYFESGSNLLLSEALLQVNESSKALSVLKFDDKVKEYLVNDTNESLYLFQNGNSTSPDNSDYLLNVEEGLGISISHRRINIFASAYENLNMLKETEEILTLGISKNLISWLDMGMMFKFIIYSYFLKFKCPIFILS